MKKIFLIVTVFVLSFISFQVNIAEAKTAQTMKTAETVIQTRIGNVVYKDKPSKVVLYGTYREDNSIFAENIRIEVKEFKTGKTILTLKPKENAGYMPSIILEDFTKQGTKQIFLGINSGGSGGFGYFYLYSAAKGTEKVLFSDESWNEEYFAEYQDNYKVKINNKDKTQNYIIDLSLRDNEYLSQIYDKNGILSAPKSADVSGVNTVFPYYNTAQGVFQLQVLQRITGLYNADSLGYVINQLEYKDGNFKPYYTMVGIT